MRIVWTDSSWLAAVQSNNFSTVSAAITFLFIMYLLLIEMFQEKIISEDENEDVANKMSLRHMNS